MASSEVVHSGRVSGSSNFSQTCNLLSRYLKEKGSFGDLGFTQNFESKGAPTGTMNLFPITEKLGKDETLKVSDLSELKLGGEPAQMTIFYGGQVLVFNDFPSEKANEIITLASSAAAASGCGGGSTQNHRSSTFAPAESIATNIQNIAPAFGLLELAHSSPQQTLDSSDLPIARKNSLARFLEKRKDRISASAPYQAKKTEATVKAEPWLGLEMNRH